MGEDPTVPKLSHHQSLLDFISANYKLIKRCAIEYAATNRLMSSIKKVGLPKRRVVYDAVVRTAPVHKPVHKIEYPILSVSYPIEIKIRRSKTYRPEIIEECTKIVEAIKVASDRQKITPAVIESMRTSDLIKVCTYRRSYCQTIIMGRWDYQNLKKRFIDNELVVEYNKKDYLDVGDYQQLSCWLADLTTQGIEPNPGPKTQIRNNNRRQRNRRPRRTRRQGADRPALIMPPRHLANFMYVDNAYVRNNPGNNYLVYSFRINDLYDPDPLILSGSVSGFKEMMQFYSYYRVLGFSATINLSNNEAFDIFYGAVFSQTNLTGVISSRDDAANALENNYAKGPFILSEKTGIDRGSMKLSIKPSSLLGVPRQYFADTNYTGLGLASPSIPLWLNFIVYSPTGAALTNGYTTSTKLFFHAEFFGRLNLRA